ncbi:MAG: amidohydrolase family protein, partial [Alphaproteobacteria bacterium]
LVSYRADTLDGRAGERTLARLRELGWFAQVFADDVQWPGIAAVLRSTRVKVLVDHFGVRHPEGGVNQPGFAAVLALGRDGNAAVKFSAPFRISRRPADFADLDEFAEALLEAFGSGGCIWGSDWPFLNLPGGYRYSAVRRAVERWLADPRQREAVLWSNPARLFGFGA